MDKKPNSSRCRLDRFPISRIAFFVLLFCAPLYARNAGTLLFNDAYKTEETDPQSAITLYRQALAAGLPGELARAANWRMFFIFKDQENYSEALKVSDSLAPSARAQLEDEIKDKYNLKSEEVRSYTSAVKGLTGSKNEASAAALVKLYDKGSPGLRKRILTDLAEHGRTDEALTLARTTEGGIDGTLQECDLLIYLNKYTEAESRLKTLSTRDDLSSVQKSRLIYLLGRARRDNGGDVSIFLLAERYATSSERDRMRALAAYGLLKQGYAYQARSIMKDRPVYPDSDVQLLDLVLRAEVDGDPKAIRELQNKRASLQIRARRNKDAYLPTRALRIIGDK